MEEICRKLVDYSNDSWKDTEIFCVDDEVKSHSEHFLDCIAPTNPRYERAASGGWGLDCPARLQSQLSKDNIFACFGSIPEPMMILTPG